MERAIDVLVSRRSVKAYKPELPSAELVDKIIEAGLYAPTGRNLQSPIIIAVTDKDVRDRLSEMNAKVLGTDSDPFYGAPVVLAVLSDRTVPTYMYDGSLVMGNMLNAAHALGLGGCWIHRAKEIFDSEEGRQMLRTFGIDGDYEGIGFCVVGFPSADLPQPRPRREGRVFRVG